jgi:hypothetical protein
LSGLHGSGVLDRQVVIFNSRAEDDRRVQNTDALSLPMNGKTLPSSRNGWAINRGFPLFLELTPNQQIESQSHF